MWGPFWAWSELALFQRAMLQSDGHTKHFFSWIKTLIFVLPSLMVQTSCRCPGFIVKRVGYQHWCPDLLWSLNLRSMAFSVLNSSQVDAYLAVSSLLVALRIVRQLPIVIAPPPKARMVTNRGNDGVISPNCCRVGFPVTNSTYRKQCL